MLLVWQKINLDKNMKCKKCHEIISNKSKFCERCGTKLKKNEKMGSVDMYFYNKMNTCQNCAQTAPLMQINMYKNIGMIFSREQQQMSGLFCKKCIKNIFIEYFFTTLFLGWWGLISFIVTPFFLIIDLFYFVKSLFLKKD